MPKFLKYFQDKEGSVVLWQRPNWLLITWIVTTVLAWIIKTGWLHTALRIVATGAIIPWAILEIHQGASPFRRTLGVVVLVLSIYSLLKLIGT